MSIYVNNGGVLKELSDIQVNGGGGTISSKYRLRK